MTEIVLEQRIDASPSVVYGYLTDSVKWELWQGVGAEIDPRIGGLFSILMPNGTTARGQFVELVPDERVVFSWGWVDRPGIPPGSTTVEIALSASGQGTLLTLTHRSLPPEEIELHEIGWRHYLPRLASAAGGSPPGTDPGVLGDPSAG